MLARFAIGPFLSSSFQFGLAALLVSWTGCSGPYIRSQQFAYSSAPNTQQTHLASDCENGVDCGHGCIDGQLKLGLPRTILHAISGPFVPHEIVDPYQSTAHPPHSKFHPVPTRPVFAPLRLNGTPAATGQNGANQLPQPSSPSIEASPSLPPSPTPAEMLPPPGNQASHRAVRSVRHSLRRPRPSTRAASEDGRFVEL